MFTAATFHSICAMEVWAEDVCEPGPYHDVINGTVRPLSLAPRACDAVMLLSAPRQLMTLRSSPEVVVSSSCLVWSSVWFLPHAVSAAIVRVIRCA